MFLSSIIQNIQNPILISGIFSFILSLFLTFLALRFFPKLGFLDKPEKHGFLRKPVPYSGGLIIFLCFLTATLLFAEIDKKVIGLIFAATLIAFVSFWDDRFNLSPFFRLFVQFLAGAIIILSGVKIQLLTNPFGDSPFFLDTIKFNLFGEEIWLFSAIFIIIWLILIMNVMNWLDGIPGLASGTGIIASITIFILSIQGFNIVNQTTISVLSISLAASLLAFLIFEFPAPKILLGDTGSMFIGFLLGIFAIFSGGKIATALLVMGFPVLDAMWVIIRRIVKKSSPFRGDLLHFHHRLLQAGLSEKYALILNYSLCAVFALIALLLHSAREKFIALIILSVIMVITGFITVFLDDKKEI